MGMKVLWTVFGAATFYVVGAITAPAVIIVLENAGVVGFAGDTTTNLTRLAALLMGALGGTLGLRHAQKAERSK